MFAMNLDIPQIRKTLSDIYRKSEEDNILHFHAWVSLSWPDAHLTWEPSTWDNIKELHAWSYEIWKPDLTVFNGGEFSEHNWDMSYTDCLVSFNGTVVCVLPTKYSSHCPTDYTEWPFDKHNCSMQLGAWTFYRNEIVLNFPSDGITMSSFVANKQWDIHIERGERDYNSGPDGEGELTILVHIILQRHAIRLAMVYILPAIVFMVLTLIVLWLDSQSLERILVACVNCICHIIGLFDLHWYFPISGSETTPKILFFYEVSIGLASSALVITCLLRKLRAMNVSAPMWLMSLTTVVLNSPVGTLLKMNVLERKKDASILEENEGNGSIAEGTRDRTWQEFAMILEWFTFLLCFLIYLIMLMIVLPPGTPKKLPANYWFR
ncbi:neuronal acetylcholine receptor subunit beta-2-like isoform X2 [Venturia canescens]|uniref:neuronal acetylcholine receptor subunit beta-2-like isoform X2 n=1 Tax=Venturia canescens TaxID=32260 RepID=UPI001C9C41AD|nr:neuronal acetylcholine receptor subunit beta-2-like isoform X2 [Venturia canescens]